LLNYARRRKGLIALRHSPQLSLASAKKARDIERCEDFSHAPCSRPADWHARVAGSTGAFGENIFLGTAEYTTPLAAVYAWLSSQHHRDNLFGTQWRRQGIAVRHAHKFHGRDGVAIWVSEFTR
jgi:uncharacterized protein YkwD